MLAVMLLLIFGWKIACLEIVVELILGIALIGGGGGKRFFRTLSLLLDRTFSQKRLGISHG
jgi:hypothetical protein